MNKVVITALGVASPIGSGQSEFFSALHSGCRGIDHIRNFDTTCFPVDFGSEVKAGGNVVTSPSSADRKALFINMALAELYQQPAIHNYAAANRHVYLGAGIDYFDFPGYVENQNQSPWTGFCRRASVVVDQLAAEYDIAGQHCANVAACVASTQALGLSLRILRNETNQAIISGGFDSMLSYLHYMGFYNLGALSDWQGEAEGACRPLDKKRCGLVIGEGAAAFVLENARQAAPENILCELAGYASGMDAYMITDPEPEGQCLANAALAAICDADITPDAIDVVDMHGTGTVKNALAEMRALQRIFPRRYREIPVFCLKGQIGHLIGACGAMELLGVIDMIRHQRVLPSINCEESDPELPLNIIRGEPQALKIHHVLKLNAAFGGQNTALVVKKHGC
ncbi:MAG: beta-ketoacyl-[acyl-carrier-protein] synthase family protein [Treponema sp.]|nr:beta-ketoacyl-[acyl-carrier-protein] synthase family protein [Treponema sp.]